LSDAAPVHRAARGTAVSWPLAGRAQQAEMPVIGFISAGSPETYPQPVAAFRKALNEIGFVEGQNLAIEYRWAGNFQ
jgi:putative ABC transport system substrate-binding protein